MDVAWGHVIAVTSRTAGHPREGLGTKERGRGSHAFVERLNYGRKGGARIRTRDVGIGIRPFRYGRGGRIGGHMVRVCGGGG